MSGDKRNEATYRAVCQRSPRSEPRPAPTTLDFHGSLNLIYGKVKSQNRLAEMLGVPRRTLRRWLAGETPSRTGKDRERRAIIEESAKRLIKADDANAVVAVRRARLSPAREAKIRGARKVTITGKLRYSGEDRVITFDIGGHAGTLATGMAAGAADAVVDAFLNGATALDGATFQNSGVAAPLVAAMTDTWYHDAFSSTEPDALAFDVEKVTFS